MSLFKLLDYSTRLKMNGGENPEFLEYFKSLKQSADKQWPGAIKWSGLLTLNEGHIYKGKEMIPAHVKEAYLRCFLYLEEIT